MRESYRLRELGASSILAIEIRTRFFETGILTKSARPGG